MSRTRVVHHGVVPNMSGGEVAHHPKGFALPGATAPQVEIRGDVLQIEQDNRGVHHHGVASSPDAARVEIHATPLLQAPAGTESYADGYPPGTYDGGGGSRVTVHQGPAAKPVDPLKAEREALAKERAELAALRADLEEKATAPATPRSGTPKGDTEG
jgi:hypothetical protein